MLTRKVAALRELAEALPKSEITQRAVLPFLQNLQELSETVQDSVKAVPP